MHPPTNPVAAEHAAGGAWGEGGYGGLGISAVSSRVITGANEIAGAGAGCWIHEKNIYLLTQGNPAAYPLGICTLDL